MTLTTLTKNLASRGGKRAQKIKDPQHHKILGGRIKEFSGKDVEFSSKNEDENGKMDIMDAKKNNTL